MALVRRDSHGLYVKTGGYLFRPQRTCTPFSIGREDAKGNFEKGKRVKAHHVACTVFAKVGEERWFSHGQYYDPFTQVHINSENLWCPTNKENVR